MDLAARIRDRQGSFVLFALTPPRQSTAPERVAEIAEATKARLRPLGLDGLVLYDIDDESSRNPTERPFPFTPTLDPAAYLAEDLTDWETPVVVYRAVGKYERPTLEGWAGAQDPGRTLSVLVGAASSDSKPALTLAEAQQLAGAANPDLLLGGVAIPERHTRRGNEHERLLAKQAAGCRFFVTQVVYDVNAAKNLVSDYAYACREAGIAPVPIVFTFSVCGSMKTLEFLRWLGVDVPRWIENDLRHAEDTLQASFEQALATATELVAYCERLGVPFGLNIESVSIRKVEIDASVELARRLIGTLRGTTAPA
ncbi:methylenetetrahydrofolate reductase [Nocardioides jiangxiensis]|uniref:Methylenetetrahydrofolate reductase n=1 Tax=Nocardioides jiangxiensis TaxID=3064524 RepID=A0ABT9AWT1_9ACTN|nr:methylenetetrahydrofolate reductase [Nocardioides sp. WY-20]MDO7866755.1 methylenetetrahydrofolate reductase [Nocardioides sp. WY-20]